MPTIIPAGRNAAADAGTVDVVPTGRGSWWRSGWVPAALGVVAVCGPLLYYGVTAVDLARFVAYLVACVALPGALIWRAATAGRFTFGEQVAAGTAVGFALEVLTYIGARAVGAPLLVLAWPVAVVVAFVCVPRLRPYWGRAGAGVRAPLWHSWTVAGTFIVIMVYCYAVFLRGSTLDGPGYGVSDSDLSMHLAYLGEIKNHMPPVVPYVHGEPLLYHWFVYAEMAATSWVTGIEPFLLVRRLSIVPYLAILIVLIPATARRLTGRWWTGAAALVVTFLVLAPYPYGWPMTSVISQFGFNAVDDGSLLRPTLWLGPPQTFGAAIFAALMLILLELVRGRLGGPLPWSLFAILLIGVMGAKATYIPLLLAGLACGIAATWLVRRQLPRPWLIATGSAVACLAFAQFVLYGGKSHGMRLSPLELMRSVGVGADTGLFANSSSPLSSAAIAGIFLLGWVLAWSGLIGLLSRDRFSPELAMLVGVGVAGLGVASLFGHDGLAQAAFLQGARPYLSIAAVCGFAALLDSSGLGRRARFAIPVALAAGAVVVLMLRWIGPATMPTLVSSGSPRLLIALWSPYLALVGILAAAALVLRHALGDGWRSSTLALIVAAIAGCGLQSSLQDRLVPPIRTAIADGWRVHDPNATLLAHGTVEAGRWLRDHSNPSDLVATNVHCLFPTRDVCLNAHFAVSAFSERRVLVEGWGYTPQALAIGNETRTHNLRVPFWDPLLLATNDAAFRSPSPQTVGRLRDEYGVRWLFVDRTQNSPSAALGEFARLRFSSGECAVYELAAN